ncbi:MAG TPA: phosphoribosylglycinamide formyltransferase [Thermoleophilia bacterium]|nr:phosphoribosylglycinamide formyltransferase [Thermoleophilia bacterium]
MLVSGEGSNLQALIDASGVDVVCVVSNRPEARALERAAAAGVPALVSASDDETAAFLEQHDVSVVVLAGYMRILSPAFVDRFSGRILNVHPSLLPAFPGARAIADALAHGVRVTGVTVHLVDSDHVTADSGPIVLQEAIPVPYDQSPAELAERLHEIEHRLLPEAVRLLTSGRIEMDGRRVRIT